MRRLLSALPGLFILLLIPYRAFASSCGDTPTTQYFLDCLDGICDGFKTEEESYRDRCNYMPTNVFDLRPNEAEHITDYLLMISKLGKMNGRQQLIVSIPTYCAMEVQTKTSSTTHPCSDYDVAHTNIKIQANIMTLVDWRQEVEATIQAKQQEYDAKKAKAMAIGAFIVVVLPMGLIIFLSRKDNMLFLASLLGIVGLQVMVLCTVTYVGLFNGWPLFTMGLLIFAIMVELSYFIWHQNRRKRSAQVA